MAKKKKRFPNHKPKKKNKNQIIDSVINFFNKNTEKAYNLTQVAENIGLVTNPDKQILLNILSDLVEDAFLVESSKQRYKTNTRGIYLEGIFERHSNGKNIFKPDDDSGNIAVAERNSARAMNGDRVKILLYAQIRGKNPEGEVVEIINRAKSQFVGVLDVQPRFAFLLMDSKILANDIFIPKDLLNGGEDGDKVLVEIVEWPEKAKNPIGKVIDVLGKPGDNNTEMHAILAEYGLPYSYPEEIEALANKIPEEITEDEIKRREDMRGVTTFTIDPLTAKDFDDALSIRKLKNGLWEVGVHIADVTHYVKEGDEIDQEAEKRATSVYLVDRTIPMLPEKLSNFLCSLRPNEDKLAYSVLFEIDENANIRSSRITRTVIHSDRRFTYEEAQEIIEGKDGDFKNEILKLDEFAKKIRKQRYSDGAIDFDRHEMGIETDEKGKPVRIYFKYAKDSNKLIEEFMLLANRTVAEKAEEFKQNGNPKTFVYRVHDLPNQDKLENLSRFIKIFGYKLVTEGSKLNVAKSLNNLLELVHGKPEETLISTIAVRTMSKAIYTTTNIGHYGLAFDYYTHFTSPIRRFPDMMVHRLLTKYMEKENSVSKKEYERKCEHSSEMEQLASNAERSSIKYKQVEYMSDKLGEEYSATISGVTEWGIYAEIDENKCEGMIPLRDLDDDFYEFDEKNYCLRGKRNKKVYRLGDPIKICVARTNLERKQLDFALVK